MSWAQLVKPWNVLALKHSLTLSMTHLAMNYELMKIAKECRPGDIAVLRFPYRCFLTFAGNKFVNKLHDRGAQSVLLIHDLDSLRRPSALERMGQFSLTESMHCDIAF